MQKSKIFLISLLFLLATVSFQVGVSHAQEDNFTAQHIVTNSAGNYISFLQGIKGLIVPNFNDNGLISVSFNNVTVNGIYNVSYGIGSFRNQGSLAFLNIQPDMELSPAVFLGQTFSENNRAVIDGYNYSINLNFNGFAGSGIVVLNLMAGSFSSQFTSVHFSMGKDAIPPPSTTWASLTKGNDSTLVSLSNDQMQTIAATANNDIKILGKQSALATVQGTPEVQGICAITVSSGVNNQITHHVGVNIDTRP
jgi:hypothetical protein